RHENLILNPDNWVKYRFLEKYNLPTFNEITSNLSEQANSWMGKELRSAKPLDTFHIYFLKLSELLSTRRQEGYEYKKTFEKAALIPIYRNSRQIAVKLLKCPSRLRAC
ncbi:hypothetical protein F443_19515, partial [Phytophthora nicotianae P1569]